MPTSVGVGVTGIAVGVAVGGTAVGVDVGVWVAVATGAPVGVAVDVAADAVVGVGVDVAADTVVGVAVTGWFVGVGVANGVPETRISTHQALLADEPMPNRVPYAFLNSQ